MTTCPSCHRDQAQSSAFCTYCGAVLDRPASAATAASPPPGQAPAKTRHEFGDVGAYVVRRLLALVVDVAVVGSMIAVALWSWLANAGGGRLTAAGFFQLTVALVVALFLYRWLFEGLVGTTLGKLLFGLVVARKDGGGAGIARAFVRTIVLPLDLALVGFLLAAVTPQRRRIGDFAAGTVVANSRLGALAPIAGILVLAAAAFADQAYAGGLGAAGQLARDAVRLAPSLVATPAPPRTPPPTAQPSPAAANSST